MGVNNHIVTIGDHPIGIIIIFIYGGETVEKRSLEYMGFISSSRHVIFCWTNR